MIFTQTMRDLGHPPWIPKGAIIITAECDTDKQGFGVGGYNGALEEAVKVLYKEYSQHAVIVNANIERKPGSAHESYCRTKVHVTGDLYLRQIYEPDDRPQKLPYGLKEL